MTYLEVVHEVLLFMRRWLRARRGTEAALRYLGPGLGTGVEQGPLIPRRSHFSRVLSLLFL